MYQDNNSSSIISLLEENGFRAKIVPISVLMNLKKEIERIKKNLSEIFFEERLSFFEFQLTENFITAKSILVTAAPQFCIKLNFVYKEKEYNTLVPPTYSYKTDVIIREILKRTLTPSHHHFEDTKLPVKLIAYISGMAKYGRNNITYLQGLGSFFRLKCFYTDIQTNAKLDFEFNMMEECQRCSACINACPTQAITKDGFLIKAEKCLTFLNERTGNFPEWVNPKWHNCIIGCMKCQFSCPINLKFKENLEDQINFDENETDMILNAIPREKLTNSVIDKLKRINLLEDYNLMPRNLKAILTNN
ncbi:MAG: 4Fe-4S binding protein [Candidatus Lokiarchaeota archaeon]|nr:4Fe-4S binding protein [Candidatus Lokiarchaeota archaeon]